MYNVGVLTSVGTKSRLIGRDSRSIGLLVRARVIKSVRFILGVLSVFISNLLELRISVSGRVRGMDGVGSITLRRFSAGVGVIRGEGRFFTNLVFAMGRRMLALVILMLLVTRVGITAVGARLRGYLR